MLPADVANKSRLRMWLRRILFVKPVVRELRGDVLDFGCGMGDFLREYDGGSFGIDLEPLCIEYCRQVGLADVAEADAQSFQLGRKFDTVLLHCLLEHVDKPTEVLINADASLKNGGRMVITLTCLRNFVYGMNDWYNHKQYVPVEYVDRCLVRQLGYKKLKARTFPPVGLPYLWRYQEVRCVYEKPE